MLRSHGRSLKGLAYLAQLDTIQKNQADVLRSGRRAHQRGVTAYWTNLLINLRNVAQ